MFNTLRSQLVLSHILPPLVTIPLIGIALVYFLESKVVLPKLVDQLADDTIMIAKVARAQPEIFSDQQLAAYLLEDVELETNTRIMILNPSGVLLASSDASDKDRLNQIIDTDGLSLAQRGIVAKHLDFSPGLKGEVIDVFAPVIDREGRFLGIVRVSYRYATVSDYLMRVRYLIVGIIALGVITSAILGFLLALNIDHPISQVTQAIFDLASGARTDRLPEQGPREIKMLEQAANFLVSRLHELEKSRRQLLANLIHELSRPLGGLHMGIQVLRRGAKDDPQVLNELLVGMEIEARLLQRLVEDLSNLHDQIIGTRELELRMVALSNWLPALLNTAQEAAFQKGLRWVTHIPKNLPELKIDPQRMAQVIGNLTSNAIKYTPRGGTINVEAGEIDQNVWIRVSDTGPGIPIEEQKRIFEPFFRGTQKQRIKQGMGLGLSIARDLVVAHQGYLEVHSKPNEGSQFTIWLPLRTGKLDHDLLDRAEVQN